MAEQLAGIREERIFELCDRLSPGKKAQLVKHLLGDQSLQVVFGNSQLHVGTMHQINLSDKDKMAMLLRVIADKILK